MGVALVRVAAVLVLGSVAWLGGCTSLTQCTANADCEGAYRCDPASHRCVLGCTTDAECPQTQRCSADQVCVDNGGGASSSGGTGSSGMSAAGGTSVSGSSLMGSSSRTSGGSSTASSNRSSSVMAGSSSSGVASSSRASTSAMGSSSSSGAGTSSSASSSSSSGGNGVWDSCNGDDDDGDGRTDEDRWSLVLTVPMPISTDATYLSRVAVAASDSGFYVAYSAFCTGGSSSEVFVNHVSLGGALATTGSCTAALGVQASNSSMLPSRQPALAAEGGRRAGLVWTEATGAAGADLNLADVTLEPNGTLRVGTPLRVGRVYSFYPSGTPEGHNAYGDVALLGTDRFLTTLTDGTNVDNEHAFVRVVQPGAGGLEVASNGVDLGRSNFGEAAVAHVGANHAVAWSLEESPGPTATYIQFFNATQQPLRGTPASLEAGFEINLLGMEGNELAMTYAVVAQGNDVEVRVVTLTVTGTPVVLGNPFTVPNTQAQYGSAYVGDGELVVVAADSADGKTRMSQVNVRNGARCGVFTVDNGTDGVAAGVAVQGEYMLVLLRHGPNDQPSDSSRVDAHILRRSRG